MDAAPAGTTAPDSATGAAAAPPGAGRWRVVAYRVPAARLVLALGVTGSHELVTGWHDARLGGSLVVQDVAWGVAEAALIALPLALTLVRVRWASALRVAASAAVAQLLVAVALLEPDPFGIAVVVLTAAAVALSPVRSAVLHPELVLRARRLVPAGAAALALLGWAVVQAVAVAHSGEGLVTADALLARSGQVGAAVATTALGLLCLVSAVVTDRTTPVLLGAGAGVLAIACLLHPDLPSSPGTAPSLVALLASVVLLVVTGVLRSRPAASRR